MNTTNVCLLLTIGLALISPRVVAESAQNKDQKVTIKVKNQWQGRIQDRGQLKSQIVQNVENFKRLWQLTHSAKEIPPDINNLNNQSILFLAADTPMIREIKILDELSLDTTKTEGKPSGLVALFQIKADSTVKDGCAFIFALVDYSLPVRDIIDLYIEKRKGHFNIFNSESGDVSFSINREEKAELSGVWFQTQGVLLYELESKAEQTNPVSTSGPHRRVPIQIEDKVEPLGSVHFWLRIPTGNNAEMTLNGTSYEQNILVYVGRFGFYTDGGGFEPSPDGYGKIKENTRVLVNKTTGFGLEFGKDGCPKTYLLHDKSAKCLIGVGRYRYLSVGSSNEWYDIWKGEKISPDTNELEPIQIEDNKGKAIEMYLPDFIKKYQETLNRLNKDDSVYLETIGKYSNVSDRLSAAISYHNNKSLTKLPLSQHDKQKEGSGTSPDTKVALQNKLAQVGVVARHIDDDAVLITEGFPYRKDLTLDYKIDIVKVERGVFTASENSTVPTVIMGMGYAVTGGSFIAQCNTKEGTQTFADAVGNTWVFIEPSMLFDVYLQGSKNPVYALKSKTKGATISFTEDGVLLKGFDFHIYPSTFEPKDTKLVKGLSFERKDREIEISTAENQTWKGKIVQYRVLVPASTEFPLAIRGIDTEIQSKFIATSGFMQAANLNGTVINFDKTLKDLVASVHCEPLNVDMKTQILFAVSCEPGLSIAIDVDYIGIRNGELDAIICTYELDENKASEKKPLTLVAVPRVIVGDVKVPIKFETPRSKEQKQ